MWTGTAWHYAPFSVPRTVNTPRGGPMRSNHHWQFEARENRPPDIAACFPDVRLQTRLRLCAGDFPHSAADCLYHVRVGCRQLGTFRNPVEPHPGRGTARQRGTTGIYRPRQPAGLRQLRLSIHPPGLPQRRRAHQPAVREELDAIYDQEPAPLTILVPSYKEEIEVVRALCCRQRCRTTPNAAWFCSSMTRSSPRNLPTGRRWIACARCQPSCR